MATPRGARAHVFVDDLSLPQMTDEDRHHVERVLRLRAGDLLTVSDGVGGCRPCRFGEDLEPIGAVVREQASEPAVTIAFAVIKGDRPEWAVQKLTEVGVDRIVPMHTDRSVVRWEGPRADRHIERLRRVAREAAMQSRRAYLPVVESVRPMHEVLARPGAARAEADGAPVSITHPLILIGPEGGWSDAERAVSMPTVRLAATVLRTETAAVAAGVLLTALRPGGALNAKGG